MKKIVLTGVAIVVAAALVGPKIVGSQFSQGIEDTVAAINNNPAYTASITSLESTWFNTQAQISVGVNMPDMGDLSEEPLDMSVDILVNGDHGPILTSNGFNLAWLYTQIEVLSGELPEGLTLKEDLPIYALEAYTGLLGGSTYTDKVVGMNYVNEENQVTIDFSGSQSEGSFSSSNYEGKTLGNGANVSGKMGDALAFELTSLEADIEAEVGFVEMLEQGLYDSNTLFTIANIKVDNLVDGTQTNVDSLAFNVTSSLDDNEGFGDVVMQTTLASAVSDGFNLSELITTIELNNLEVAFFQAYQKFSNEIIDYAANPEKMAEATNTFFEENLLSQLQAEPEYNISALSGKINDSAFNGTMFAKVAGVTALPDTLEDTQFWAQHAIVNSELTLQQEAAEYFAKLMLSSQLKANPQFAAMSPEELDAIIAQQAAPTLQALVQQGMITQTDDGYAFNFSMKEGTANLNGLEIPLSAF